MQKLTKAEIIKGIADKTGSDGATVHQVIDEFFEEVKDGLAQGRTVELRNFGTFEVRIRKGKAKGRNPKTGEEVAIPRHGAVAFRGGRELKTALWEITEEA